VLEWTNQHGCGEDESKLNCNIVIQYMCQSNGTNADYPSRGSKTEEVEGRTLYLRDGVSTDTQVRDIRLLRLPAIWFSQKYLV
jgi:hypothetical protein